MSSQKGVSTSESNSWSSGTLTKILVSSIVEHAFSDATESYLLMRLLSHHYAFFSIL